MTILHIFNTVCCYFSDLNKEIIIKKKINMKNINFYSSQYMGMGEEMVNYLHDDDDDDDDDDNDNDNKDKDKNKNKYIEKHEKLKSD